MNPPIAANSGNALTIDAGNMRGRGSQTCFDIPHRVEPLGISFSERLDEHLEVFAIGCAGELPAV
jgi:hypothetical protein